MKKTNLGAQYGPLLIGIASILWSLDGFLRRSLYTVSPLVIVTVEHVLGLLILLLFVRQWWPEVRTVARKTWGIMAVIALFSGLLGTLFYTAALGQVQYIQYSVVVLLQQIEPIFVLLTAHIFLKEKLQRSFIAWFTVAMIGAYLITFKDLTVSIVSQTGTFYAALLALGAAVCWGSTTVLSKLVLNKTSALTATVMRFFLTSLIGIAALLFTSQLGVVGTLAPSQLQMIGLISVSTGMVALAIYYLGLQKIPAKVATLFELIWPASALLTDIFIFKSSFSLTQVLGLGLLATALYKVKSYKQ